MNPISITGAFIITLSLLFYGVGSITLQRFKMISPGVLWFLSIGLLLEIAAVICMIIGAQNMPFTLHVLLGYSALLVMSIDVVLVWRLFYREGKNAFAGKKLLIYSKIAYGWFLIAYLTGSMLVIWR